MQAIDDARKPVHSISERDFTAKLPNWRTNIWPEHWPENVRSISLEGLGLLGLDDEGNLYLNGKRLYTERRLASQERLIAWLVAISTFVGAVAAVISVLQGA